MLSLVFVHGLQCKLLSILAVNLKLLPPKGFTLPLISYGGTSMIFAVISLAIILRVDMENKTNYSKQIKYV